MSKRMFFVAGIWFQLPGRICRKFLLQGFGFICLPPICREFLSQGLSFNCLPWICRKFCCRDSASTACPGSDGSFCCRDFASMPGLDTQEIFVAGRDLVSTAWRDLQEVFVAGICFHCLARICREFLLQGLRFNAWPGYAGNFCRRQGFAGSLFVAGIWLQLPAPDLQGVFVAGIMLRLPALDLQEVLLQGFCFNCPGSDGSFCCRDFASMPGLDTQEIFVAGRDLVSTAWRDLQEVFVAGICFHCLARICRELLSQGLRFNAWPGYAGNCRRQGFGFNCRDLQEVFVAGICFHCLARIRREFLSQGLCFTCLAWVCRIFCCSDLVSTARPDLQEVSVARI